MADKVVFQTNIPKTLAFPYGDFKEKAGAIWEGKQLPVSFQYTVEEGSESRVLFATEYLHKELQRVGVAKGSEFEITLAEDSQDKKKKVWLINGGQEPQDNDAPARDEPPPMDDDPGPYVGNSPQLLDNAPSVQGAPPMAEIGAVYFACLRMSLAAWKANGGDFSGSEVQAGAATMFIAADRGKVKATPKMHEAFKKAMKDG